MLLRNLHIIGQDQRRDIHIKDGKIRALCDAGTNSLQTGELHLEFDSAAAFPGLINSHDHLDFNLFPPLGSRIYPNYKEWGNDIHRHYKTTIRQVLKVPQPLRTQYGIYKNLLNGITTVVNHGPPLTVSDPLINVFQQYRSLHSVSFEKNWKLKLNKPFAGKPPIVIHTGEGTDSAARGEIDRLIRWNIFRRALIGIHGVAMTNEQARAFRALVWCPASNYFLLDATAPVGRLKQQVKIIFGTDSTLTAPWNLWEHLRQARATGMMTDEELFGTLTTIPASVWNLRSRGRIAPSLDADIVVAKMQPGTEGMNAFYGINPEDILLVLHKGTIRLFDEKLRDQLKGSVALREFSRITLQESHKFVQGNLPGLLQAIKSYHPGALFPVHYKDNVNLSINVTL